MTQEFVRPDLAIEPVAKIEGISKIESNIAEVKKTAMEIKEFYENLVITEDDTKVAKDEKAKIKKMIDAVKRYRLDTAKEFTKPIEKFTNEAKETEKLLQDAYDTINSTVTKFENARKAEKEKKITEYFDELIAVKGIDFVTFKDTKISVTLSASEKALKASVDEFVNRIVNDLALIETQAHPVEILAEYKTCLDVSRSIMVVSDRMARIENERKAREEELKRQEEEKAALASLEANMPAEEEFVSPDFEIPVEVTGEETGPGPNEATCQADQEDNELLTMTFTVTGTIDQLRDLKQFIIERGIRIND